MSEEQTIQKILILQLLSIGSTATQIGEGLDLSGRTVEKYIEELKKEYGAKNVTHLVAIALRNKIIK